MKINDNYRLFIRKFAKKIYGKLTDMYRRRTRDSDNIRTNYNFTKRFIICGRDVQLNLFTVDYDYFKNNPHEEVMLGSLNRVVTQENNKVKISNCKISVNAALFDLPDIQREASILHVIEHELGHMFNENYNSEEDAEAATTHNLCEWLYLKIRSRAFKREKIERQFRKECIRDMEVEENIIQRRIYLYNPGKYRYAKPHIYTKLCI